MSPLQLTWTPLVLPLLGGLAIMAYLLINAARSVSPGIKWTRLLLLSSVTWWIICSILEMLSSTLVSKLSFTKLGYLGFSFIPTLMFIYAMQYVNSQHWLTPINTAILLIIPFALIALAFTNEWHGLMWHTASLNTSVTPPVLDKDMSAGFMVFIAYALLLSAIAFGFLLYALRRASQLHKRHIRVLIYSFLALNIAMAVNSINVGNNMIVGLEPYGGLIATLGLSRTIMGIRGADILPIAREIAIEQLPNPVLVTDTQGNLVAYNRAAYTLIGVGKKAPQTLSLATCCPLLAEQIDLTSAEMQEFELDTTQDSRQTPRMYSGRISPVKDAREKTVSYVISLQDITALRQADIERQQRHRYRQALWAAIPDAVVVLDASGRVQECNASAITLLGENQQGVSGLELRSLIAWDTETLVGINTWLNNKEDRVALPQMRISIPTTSGTTANMILSGAKLTQEKVLQAVILVFTDVSKLLEIEQKLRDVNAKLEARVVDRTSELRETNHKLQIEISRYEKASVSLTERNRELLSLQSAVAATGSSLDIAFVLETVTWEMVDFLDVDACRVYEWHQDRNEVELVADSKSLNVGDDSGIQRVLDLSVCSMYLRTLREKYAQEIEPNPNSTACSLCNSCDKMAHRILLPMVFQGQSVGLVLLTLKDGSGKLTDRQVSLGQLLANQAAVAIDHARLYSRAQHEIAQRERVEQQLRASLHEKDTLLQEIHHRVKNNLQVISSLLNLQSHTVTDPMTIKALQDSQNRLRSMALIHERLYQSDNLARIDFGDYLRSLASYLVRSYRSSSGPIAVGYRMDEVHLNIERAVPCGLIVNELLTNALKYAFPDGRPGRIEVGFTLEGQIATLQVSDDGVGLPDELDVDKLDSLGLQLVHMLTEQLHGELNIVSQPGTTFLVTFEL